MMAEEKPHMIVGIDLGMTCTGVSYANLSIGSSTTRWVQKWPGRMQANENKVPTVIVYPSSPANSPPSSWGFLSETIAETNSDDKDFREWFKTMLDPDKLKAKQKEDPEGAPGSLAEVQMWYEDYLRKMYEYLAFKLGSELSGVRWETARIEFIFSVPTTWPVHPTVELFKTIVAKAGYGQHKNHSVSIGLTEAEAAAVHISTEAPGIFRERDILLVCDAGGGTTDLTVLRVTGTGGGHQAISLQQLDVVFGETIGSAAIDYEFEKMVHSKLAVAHETAALPIPPEDAAWEMMKSRDFQSVKCEFGALDDTPLFSISIPRVPQTYNNPSANIKNGELTFNREDLQKLFDKQIQKLYKLIDTQLQSLLQKFPNEPVAHLVLSGGLGNSAYVQSQLKHHYATSRLRNAHHISVRIAPDPQLAVCKGLVSDRVSKVLTSQSVLGWRCCRSSYGTVCKILYDKKNPEHQGKELTKDPLNGKYYICQAIAWFVRKGEPVSTDRPIVHSFVKKLGSGDPRKAFPTSVVECTLDANRLPDQMSAQTRILCDIQADLGTADEKKFQEKNKRFWSLGKHYYKVAYQVKVIIGPADIRFELWFENQKLSRDQSIHVEWLPTPVHNPASVPPAELPVPPSAFPSFPSPQPSHPHHPPLGLSKSASNLLPMAFQAYTGNPTPQPQPQPQPQSQPPPPPQTQPQTQSTGTPPPIPNTRPVSASNTPPPTTYPQPGTAPPPPPALARGSSYFAGGPPMSHLAPSTNGYSNGTTNTTNSNGNNGKTGGGHGNGGIASIVGGSTTASNVAKKTAGMMHGKLMGFAQKNKWVGL